MHNFRHGRPLQNLVHGLLPYETGAGGGAINMAAHTVQGLFHCLAAALLAYLLSRGFADRWPFVAMLLFLLWPFHGEAVLWRSAGSMPIAAFLSVLGVVGIDAALQQHGRETQSRITATLFAASGIALIALAGLFHQLGAAAGLAGLMAYLATSRQERTGTLVGQLALTICGYALGALLVLVITANYRVGENRAQMADDLTAKIDYLWQLTRRFLVENLPTSVMALQVGLAVGLLVIALFTLFARQERLGHRLLRVAAMVALFVAPVLPVLLVKESPTSARTVYFSPLLLATSVILLAQLASLSGRSPIRSLLAHYAIVLVVAVLSVRYMVLSQMNAQDFVTIYRGDIAQLRQIEQRIADAGSAASRQVVVASPERYLRTYDLYGIRFLNGDAKASAFQVPWSVGKFIDWRSTLTPVVDIEVTNQCSALCQLRAQDQPFYIESLLNSDITCVCP